MTIYDVPKEHEWQVSGLFVYLETLGESIIKMQEEQRRVISHLHKLCCQKNDS